MLKIKNYEIDLNILTININYETLA